MPSGRSTYIRPDRSGGMRASIQKGNRAMSRTKSRLYILARVSVGGRLSFASWKETNPLAGNRKYQDSAEDAIMSLPSSPYHPTLRLNAVCPYYTMFPLSFPYEHLARTGEGDWVLDPFCGRGTTNYAARLRGLPSIGIDASPIARAIAAAKFVAVDAEAVAAEAERILTGAGEPADVPEGEFWSWAFHEQTLREICRIRENLLTDNFTPARVALRAVVMGVLHGPLRKNQPSYLSNQMPRTYSTKPAAAVRY